MTHRQRGISVPEILVAAVLIGLAVLCITPIMTYGMRTSTGNKEHAAAVQAAQRVVEQVQAAGFSAAATIVNAGAPSAILSDDLQGNKLYINGKGEVYTSPRSNTKLLQVQRIYTFGAGATPSPADDLIQVTVKVTWPGSNGRNITLGATLTRSVAD